MDSSPIVLVTGACAGIGEASALALTAAGCTVIGAAHDPDRLEPLRAKGVAPHVLDVTDDESMIALVEDVIAEHGRIDVLVNSAGRRGHGSVTDVPPDEARRLLEVGVLGPARLSQLVLPRMRSAGSGHIINVTPVPEPSSGWLDPITRAVAALSEAMRADVAADGVRVSLIEPTPSDTPQEVADRLTEFITAPAPPRAEDDLRPRLLAASGSFRKKHGRHELRTASVMYCAFSTPNFTVRPEEAGRDATQRVAAFGLTREQVEGRTVLDLGSNAGAMLFELSNFDPASGYGIEYDVDKVDLANEIAEVAGIENVRFVQGDIDHLTPAAVGVHDIVLALAIESHVLRPRRLYHLLGQVTGDVLCFEGNAGCDMDRARGHLAAAGFGDFVDLGFCRDDSNPSNNRRPQLLARKVPTRQHRPLPPLRTLRNHHVLERAAGRLHHT